MVILMVVVVVVVGGDTSRCMEERTGWGGVSLPVRLVERRSTW
jgi:hypothetical protein